MAYLYKRIEELTPLNSLVKTDYFLVARNSATGANYATYKTMLETLSNQIRIDVTAMKILVNDINACQNVTTSAATARLTYENYSKCRSLETSYNTLNTKVNNLSTSVNNLQNVVHDIGIQINNIINVNTLPMYHNQSPTVRVYKFINAIKSKYEAQKTAYLSSGIYYGQTQTIISCITSEFKYKPIVHRVATNSNIVVTTDMGNTFIFMNDLVNGWSKQQCHSNCNTAALSSSYHSLGTAYNSYNPAYIGQCKEGTMLFIYDDKKFNADIARISPNLKNGFSSGQVIRVEEFPV